MIKGKRAGHLAAHLRTDRHEIISGVTRKLGGDDEGPDPHELFESALAGCTIITVLMYAQRKSWPLEDVRVKVQIESEGEETKISREVELFGELNDAQRTRLLEIANKCPIHRILTRPIVITTTLAESPEE